MLNGVLACLCQGSKAAIAVAEKSCSWRNLHRLIFQHTSLQVLSSLSYMFMYILWDARYFGRTTATAGIMMDPGQYGVQLYSTLISEKTSLPTYPPTWLFRRLGDSTLSTITSSICSLEEAKGSAKIIPLVLQCLSESHDDFASFVGRHTRSTSTGV